MSYFTELCIATPVWNSTEYIDVAIKSVLSQRGDFRLRYHIQDGGSTDGTLEKIECWSKIVAQQSENIVLTYSSEPDCGMYDAVNRAMASLEPSANSILAWINADDVFEPGAFQTVFEAANVSGYEWFYGYPSLIDTDGQPISIDMAAHYPRELLATGLADGWYWDFFQQEGCFFSKRLWDEARGCASSFRLAGDWDLWCRFAAITTPVRLDRALASFRVHPGQLSENLNHYMEEIESALPASRRRRNALRLALSCGLSSICITGKLEEYQRQATLASRIRITMRACGLQCLVQLLQGLRRRNRGTVRKG